MKIKTVYFLMLLASLIFQTGALHGATVTREPYIQLGTPDSVVIVWRTDSPTDSVVNYGISSGSLNQSVVDPSVGTRHEIKLLGLNPSTRYYYSIGTSSETLAQGPQYFFETSPTLGARVPIRIWALGDAGFANADQTAVRDAMINEVSQSGDIDLWLMLGDNAYFDGTDLEFQAAVFNMYPSFLRNRSLWLTMGNHDGHTADSATQTGPYYDIFVLPENAQAGGLPSGTEAYYSFDYGNIHFICLDSYDSPRGINDPMLTWAAQDAIATDQDWIIAFWHHPPYSKNTDSDLNIISIDMRENALPILEAAGVDLVLTGHSHSYERSFFINGAYDTPTTAAGYILDGGDGRVDGDGAYIKSGNVGTVYSVVGSSGSVEIEGPMNHILMDVSFPSLGSAVIDVNTDRLDFFFLDSNGNKTDRFAMVKDTISPPPNRAPTAYDQNVSVIQNLDQAITLFADDPDLDPLTYSIVNGLTNGVLTGTPPNLLYTPDLEFLGNDSLTFKANDGEFDSNTATVSIDVTLPVLDIRVISGNDDAEEYLSSGSVDLISTDLEMIREDSDQVVGIRFQNVFIPQGAQIDLAYLQFKVDEAASEPTSLIIQGEAVDDAGVFLNQGNNISQRPRTSASVNWSPLNWTAIGEEGEAQKTSELASIVQEIVNRSGWNNGNSMAFILNGSGQRVAESFNGDSSGAPLLHVEFTLTGVPPSNQAPTVNAGPDVAISLPVSSVSLNGNVSDDGLPNPPGVVNSHLVKGIWPGNGDLCGRLGREHHRHVFYRWCVYPAIERE